VAEADESESGWPVGLTRLALEDAVFVFSDSTVEGFEDVEFHVDLLEIQRTAYGGAIYDKEGRITLVSQLAGAPLKIEAAFDSEILRATSTGKFSAKGLNVGLGAPYAAQMLGWRDLRGSLDVEVDFSADEGRARSPRIALDLNDFAIAVEGEEDPALTWESLAIAIDAVDLETNSVSVSEVVLRDLAVRLRPAAGQPLVVLSKFADAQAEPDDPLDRNSPAAGSEPVAEPQPGATGLPEPAEDGAADPSTGGSRAGATEAAGEDARVADTAANDLQWRVAKISIDDARLIVESPEKTLDVGVQVEVADLSNEAGSKGHVRAAVSIEGGSLDVSGAFGLYPPTFDGAVDLSDLSLPSVLSVAPDPRVEIVRGGVVRADLKVLFDMGADGEGGSGADASVSGTVGLAGLEVSADDPSEFSLGWKDLAVAVAGVDLRGGVPATEDGQVPIRIASIDLVAPSVVLTRLEDGTIALPPQLAQDEAAIELPEDDGAGLDNGSAGPGVSLNRFRLTHGKLRLTDRTVQPSTQPGLNKVKLSLDDVHMPEKQIGRIDFSATGLKGGLLVAKGKLDGESTDVLLTLDKYRLVPYDPYAATFSGYGIRRGTLSVESQVRLEGDDFDTHTKVIVHKLGIKNTSGTTEFEDQVGVPISLALALLKDTQGDIELDVPVSGSGDDTSVGVGAVVGQQLRRILINALASPLKLFGVGSGEDEELSGLSAARIGFADGARALSAAGRAETEKLAELLRERPDLAVSLDVVNSLRDVRPLQEKALLAELDKRDSLDENFVAIRSYLRARSSGDGEAAELPPHLEPILEDLLSHRKPAPETIAALSASRVGLVRNTMITELHVRPRQVTVKGDLSTGLVDGPPVVEAELGVVEDAEDDAEDEVEGEARPPVAAVELTTDWAEETKP